ncbi:MAG: response regulator, partial [Gammaproteobacteria bacterium]|nr:response regulator [Gammaproteobacteria bacterium]
NTHNCTLDSDICSRNPDIPPGEYIRLTVRDNGRGIPAEQHERIFEPFFTTKAQGKGTGLGLAMVFGFIKRSSGYIKLESEPDRGTTFHIYLPRANATEGSHTPAGAKIDDSQRGHETILLVDDEQDLLELARESLLSLGYRVLTAQDGHEALKLINAEPGIDLMCSDVVMPGGINGYQLADRASAMRPNLKLLLVSGYTEKIITQRSHATPAIQLLSKPYTQTELACQVRMLLD